MASRTDGEFKRLHNNNNERQQEACEKLPEDLIVAYTMYQAGDGKGPCGKL